MSGISPKLPLFLSEEHGAYGLNKTFKEVTKQNFKNLLLTEPGEKVMDPNFGIGLRRLLFEQDARYVQSEIEVRAQKQVEMYLPHVTLTDVEISRLDQSEGGSPNVVSVKIKYRIVPFNQQDMLDITIE